MLKQPSSRMKKALAVLLAVLFVTSNSLQLVHAGATTAGVVAGDGATAGNGLGSGGYSLVSPYYGYYPYGAYDSYLYI